MPTGILSSFPDHFGAPLPEFNADGILDPGDYAPTRPEFEDRFVNFGDLARRQSIYDGWNRHRNALLGSGVPDSSKQLLNGSFTTSKPSPGDIDIVVEVPVDDETLFSLDEQHAIVKLLQGPLMKSAYHCDAYPIFSLPPDHSLYECVTAEAIRYWTKWFGQTQDQTPKGRVWATTGGLP